MELATEYILTFIYLLSGATIFSKDWLVNFIGGITIMYVGSSLFFEYGLIFDNATFIISTVIISFGLFGLTLKKIFS